MFKHAAFIRKNTPELHSKLGELGYRSLFYEETIIFHYIYTYEYLGDWFSTPSNWKPDNVIDCGENEDLFLAIAAINDENDYKQWFIDNSSGEWMFCEQDLLDWQYGDGATVYTRKASIEELIEYLKK